MVVIEERVRSTKMNIIVAPPAAAPKTRLMGSTVVKEVPKPEPKLVTAMDNYFAVIVEFLLKFTTVSYNKLNETFELGMAPEVADAPIFPAIDERAGGGAGGGGPASASAVSPQPPGSASSGDSSDGGSRAGAGGTGGGAGGRQTRSTRSFSCGSTCEIQVRPWALK